MHKRTGSRTRTGKQRLHRGSRNLTCGVLIAVASTAPCYAAANTDTPAQSKPAAAASQSQPVTLPVITVTADRRRQPAREVPMQVGVIAGQTLQQQGAHSLNDYVDTQPGVVFTNEGGPGRGKLIMRGISTGNETSSTVSEYIDDVPIGGSTVYASSGSYVFDPALLDISNVQFLYGPQGTLYGAGSMGGLVKFVTVKPDTNHFYGNVGGGLAQGARGSLGYDETAMLNAPLLPGQVAMQVSLLDRYNPGTYDGVGPAGGTDIDGSRTRGGRIQLQAYATSGLTFNLSAMSQTISANGMSMADYNLDGQPISGGPWNRELNHREPYRQGFNLLAFHATYDFGVATMDWTSAYQTFDNRAIQDYPNGFLGLLNQLGPLLGINQKLQTLFVNSDYMVHKASQEVRFVSHPNKQLDWLAGLWLTREDEWEGFGLQGANVPPPVGQTALLGQRVGSRYDEYAVYGDVTWHATPRFDVTAGIRESGNKQVLWSFEEGPVAGTPGGFREHTNAADTTGLFTMKYRPAHHQTLYFRAASGYRPGGLQSPVKATIIGSNPAATDTFRSDSLKSYEFGYKGSWLQDRVNAAVSGYHIDWHRMQLETYLLGNGVIENTGNAQIDGVQAQASWRTDHWNISGGAAYNNARTVQVDPLGSIQKGAQLPYSAKRTLTLAVDYHWRFGRNPAHVGANFHATSHRNAGFTGDSSDPNFSMPGYGMLNLDGGVTLDGGKGVAIDLFLRNAFNRRVPIGTLNSLTINFLASLGGPMLVTLSQPRTVGINITVPFGHTDKH